jgi:fido (protein-threonine AMPylation protein)
MYNNYNYVDNDYIYTDKNTGVLKNLPGISCSKDLSFFESISVIKRTNELFSNPIMIETSETLLLILKCLFQDVYEWYNK